MFADLLQSRKSELSFPRWGDTKRAAPKTQSVAYLLQIHQEGEDIRIQEMPNEVLAYYRMALAKYIRQIFISEPAFYFSSGTGALGPPPLIPILPLGFRFYLCSDHLPPVRLRL